MCKICVEIGSPYYLRKSQVMNKKILPSPEAGNKKDLLDSDTIFIKVVGKKYFSRFFHPAFSRSQTIDQCLGTLTRFKKGNESIPNI